jgi:hypothetical protein
MIRKRGSEPIAESMSASFATLSGGLAAWTLGIFLYLQKYSYAVKKKAARSYAALRRAALYPLSFGNLGLDAVEQFSTFTLDFGAMHFYVH